MNRPLASAVAALTTAAAGLGTLAFVLPGSATATGPDSEQVCAPLTTGKQDVSGTLQSITFDAPPGTVITGYCVKAGSAKHGDGPKYTDLAVPVTTLTFKYPGERDRDISHWSVTYVDAGPTAPPSPTPSAPTPGESSSPSMPTSTPPTTAPTTTPPSTPPTAPPSTPPTAPPSTPPTTAPTAPPSTAPTATPTSSGPFDWDWRYGDPSCDALVVDYPADLPSGQANDVNIRLETADGEITLNYHNNEGTWSGSMAFPYAQHPRWPAGTTDYQVEWVQVAGTNYHWQGTLRCVAVDDGDPTTYDARLAVSEIEGWRSGRTTVRRGSAAPADTVVVENAGLSALTLERLLGGAWAPVATVTPSDAGTARVAFPRERRRGTSAYRLVLPGTESVTGASSAVFTVRVR
ncbi:hypothetical protein [Nocardioides ferulae]|uniref:hypothetical protein n=1 Tax=Nocardioides ferulae TaxID=2340821 RepID=UPI00197D51AE|nr:hypothetical protein [Nocardioides ferulae]